MASVDSRQPSSSKMRSVFLDCQSGHHSHAALIKTLTKAYNNVSGSFITAVFAACTAMHEQLKLTIFSADLWIC